MTKATLEPARLVLIAPPEDEPVDLDAAKQQIRRPLTFAEDDDWLTRAIEAARRKVEGDTGRQLMPATWELWLREFPCGAFVLPRAPLASIESVTYIDLNGDEQTLDAATYVVWPPALSGDEVSDPFARHGRVELAYGAIWPAVLCQLGAVKVRFVAGYQTVPADLQHAMLMLIGHWYQNRETVAVGTISVEIDLAYRALIRNYRLEDVPVIAAAGSSW